MAVFIAGIPKEILSRECDATLYNSRVCMSPCELTASCQPSLLDLELLWSTARTGGAGSSGTTARMFLMAFIAP